MNLQTRISVSENYLRLNPDQELDCLPYFDVCLTGNNPCLRHSGWDLCDVGWRFIEAWHMIRRVTHAPMDDAEKAIRKTVFNTIKNDGLSYRRQEPWCKPEAWMWDQGRALSALCCLAEGKDDAGTALAHAGKMLRALERIALVDGDALWFPVEGWTGKEWGSPPLGHPPTGLQIDGAVRYYKLTGEEWALAFADKVAKGVMTRTPPLFSADGGFQKKGGGPNILNTHLHSRLFIITGMLALARETNHEPYRAAAEAALQSVLKVSTSYGWVPERLEQLSLGPAALDELCCIMDIVRMALVKTVEAPAQWYDLIERYVSNQVCAHQLVSDGRLRPHLKQSSCPHKKTRRECFTDVWQRSRGSFTGALHAHEFWRQTIGNAFPDEDVSEHASPHDFDPHEVPYVDSSGCCSPSGIICLALAHLHGLEENPDGVAVHLHFPRRGTVADVEAATPEAGQLRIKLKRSIERLRVRLHPWAKHDQIKATMNGVPVPFSIADQYLQITPASGTVAIQYPPVDRQTEEPASGYRLTAFWQGNIVQRIESSLAPRIPLYPVVIPPAPPGP